MWQSWCKTLGRAVLVTLIPVGLLAVGRPVLETPVAAQQGSSAPRAAPPSVPSIENMLAAALKFNPEIRMAEAKLRDDEAELNRSRLRVMQKVIALHHTLQAHRAAVDGAEKKVQRLSEMVRRGANQPAVLQEAQQELARTRAKLDETRAELPYLLGKSSGLSTEVIRTEPQIGTNRSPSRVLSAAAATKIHQALDTLVTVNYQDQPLGEILKDLQTKVPGVAFQRNLVLVDLLPVKLTLKLGQVPLGAALLALGDTVPGLRVIIRDYGVLITWEHQIPLEGARLIDFWKPERQPAAARK